MTFVTSVSFVWLVTIGTLTTCFAYFAHRAFRSEPVHRYRMSRRLTRSSFLKFYRNGRAGRLKRFRRIALEVQSDIEAALTPPLCTSHARSFLPILADVKKHGQKLISQQTTTHRVASPEREKELTDLVTQLASLEARLRLLPKPNLTIEQVLLGKFEEER